MKVKVTAVFDIGKTNKKFFLFDADFQEVYREYIRFEEIKDEDGHPTENLYALEKWVKAIFDKMLNAPEFEIVALNFSSYGASLVHLDENGKPITPLYNYLKPLKTEVQTSFFEKYGPEDALTSTTGAPKLGMLNAGMQLYWLKYEKPEIFKKIKYSLHLPQYLSYLFTNIQVSEHTSIGCHTMLWDYKKQDYHTWVYQEEVYEKLAPLAPTEKTISVNYNGQTIEIGIGIHDSSSALIPYLASSSEPFVLVSTGTWSIAINPFYSGMLSWSDIQQNALFNMRTNGNPVKVSRLFLGNEYKMQIAKLNEHFGVAADHHKSVQFNEVIFSEINKPFTPMFKWFSISSDNMPNKSDMPHTAFEYAYHQLVFELVLLQEESIKSVIGNMPISKLYIDGGFSANEVFVKLLSKQMRNIELSTSDASLGSALGAALVISAEAREQNFVQKKSDLNNALPNS